MSKAMTYAIIETGGKQYRVSPGDKIDVERLYVDAGERVEIDKVLLLRREGEVRVGNPFVEGAKVVARVLEHGKGEKIIVFKFKAKVRYRRKRGHRQHFTRLLIEEIQG